MSKKDDLIRKGSDILGIPGEVVLGMPQIEISGFNKIRIEGHKGILEYSPELIAVKCGDNGIWVNGQGLEIRAMSAEALVITGRVQSMEFRR